MIFVEYIERERSMPWEIFRKLGGQDWSGSDPQFHGIPRRRPSRRMPGLPVNSGTSRSNMAILDWSMLSMSEASSISFR